MSMDKLYGETTFIQERSDESSKNTSSTTMMTRVWSSNGNRWLSNHKNSLESSNVSLNQKAAEAEEHEKEMRKQQ